MRPHRSLFKAVLALFATVSTLLWGSASRAVDGVVEINQTRALAGGVTPGDAPGFPVTIAATGSYRLTGNLVVSSANEIAIEITAQGVALDLNGFDVRGPVVCSGVPLNCTGSGTGVGIKSTRDRHSVRNGFVGGFGDKGIQLLGGSAHIEDVMVISNANGGIETGVRAIVKDCIVEANGGVGVAVQTESRIDGNLVGSNDADGITARESVVTGNSLTFNNGDGIETTFGGSVVRGNMVNFNRDFGLRLSSETGYGDNVVNNNDNGAVVGGIEIGANVCDSDTTCP